jgi:signal transduction histidine kinase
VTIALSIDEDAGEVNADPIQIEDVVVSLVLNARNAMPSGGILRIESGVTAVPGEPVWSTIAVSGKNRAVSTAGLAIAEDIVRLHNGRIETITTASQDTTCRVHLPRTGKAPVSAPCAGGSSSKLQYTPAS